jgi:molecular chaperone DnaK (HSP70)
VAFSHALELRPKLWQDAAGRWNLRLGIDFGTTRTVVAYCDRGNFPVISFDDEAGGVEEWFPSVVAERSGELRFGFDALQLGVDPSWTVMRSFKRLLAGSVVSPDLPVQIGSTSIPLGEMLCRFFSALKTAIVSRSSVVKALKKAPVLSAVIAVPANAPSAQRFLTLDGFRRAGFEVLALLNEPSAAGFEYTHRYRNTLTSQRDHVIVYDIGGGTFDVSLVRMSGPHHEVVTTAGINRLGGDDFDEALVDIVLGKLKMARSDVSPRALWLLTNHVRDLKERLGPNSRRISVDLASCLGDETKKPEVTVDVAAFYEAIAPLIQRTIDAMDSIIARLDREEKSTESGILPSEVAGLYVAGGASSLPAVARALRDRFGKRVHRSPYPSAAAAIGLSIFADEDAGLKLSDRFSRVFGVFREGRGGAEVTFDPIFTRDVPLPKGPHATEISCREYRAVHNVGHFRYVECTEVDENGDPRGDMASFADVHFPFDPSLSSAGAELANVDVRRFTDWGPLIRETYAIDGHGIVQVKIANLDAQYERTYRLSS